MGSAASAAICIRFNEEQPFVTGQQITGTVTFNNTLERGIKFQRIYAKIVGEVVYSVKHGDCYTTSQIPFFVESINLQEEQEAFALENDYYSWPVCFCLPAFLPPSLDQLFGDDPYIRYKVCVVFVRPKKFSRNIHRDFRILVMTAPSSNLQTSYVTIEAKNNNSSNVAVRATLTNQKRSFAPGDNFLLNLELHNPKHILIKELSIELVQHRKIAFGDPSEYTVAFSDLPNLRGFFGGNYRETLELTIPDDDDLIPSFHYMPSGFDGKPIAVKYMLKLKVKIYGFFNDIILNLPIRVHSMETYMLSSNEEEPPPPSYDVAIATY